MLLYAVLSVCIALGSSQSGQIPHGHNLKVLIDNGFKAVDTNHDGVLSTQELNSVFYSEDVNHDGNLTLAEYASYWKTSPELMGPIFNVWDDDKDGYVSANHLLYYRNLLDPNGDGIVILHEYEHYMTSFFLCVFGHGEHGHGPNCDH